MTTLTKGVLALVGAVIIGAAIWGGYEYPKALVTSAVGTPTAGNTFNTAKVAAINMAPTSASGTTTSILNGDTNDRIVLDGFASCSGLTNMFAQTAAGVTAFTLQAATTSTNAPATLVSNGNYAINMNIATATSDGYAATTTYTGVFLRRWAAGTYMTFAVNATSSAAACNVGVHYLGL